MGSGDQGSGHPGELMPITTRNVSHPCLRGATFAVSCSNGSCTSSGLHSRVAGKRIRRDENAVEHCPASPSAASAGCRGRAHLRRGSRMASCRWSRSAPVSRSGRWSCARYGNSWRATSEPQALAAGHRAGNRPQSGDARHPLHWPRSDARSELRVSSCWVWVCCDRFGCTTPRPSRPLIIRGDRMRRRTCCAGAPDARAVATWVPRSVIRVGADISAAATSAGRAN